MKIIWHGTASVEVAGKEGRILFDPFVPLDGADVPVKIEDYDGFEEIFVTHGHFDHISDLPEIARRNPGCRIHCTETPYQILAKKGIPEENLLLLQYGDVLEVCGFRIRIIHGKHAILPKGSWSRLKYMLTSSVRKNLPHIVRENKVCVENDETVFYLIEAEGKTVALMGSMNLREEVEYPTEADLLILPYNGWEDNFPHAVSTIEQLRPKRVLLDHYDDTFPPVTMPLDLEPLLEKYPELVTAMELGTVEEI